jgi:hypothetical protein
VIPASLKGQDFCFRRNRILAGIRFRRILSFFFFRAISFLEINVCGYASVFSVSAASD